MPLNLLYKRSQKDFKDKEITIEQIMKEAIEEPQEQQFITMPLSPGRRVIKGFNSFRDKQQRDEMRDRLSEQNVKLNALSHKTRHAIGYQYQNTGISPLTRQNLNKLSSSKLPGIPSQRSHFLSPQPHRSHLISPRDSKFILHDNYYGPIHRDCMI